MELYDTVRAFKAARPMCPETVNTRHPTKADLIQLRPFPFLDTDDVIGDLADELPLYLAMATDVTFHGETIHDIAEKKFEWWRSHADRLPNWASAVMLMQLSSATVERVFPLLLAALGHAQDSALADSLEC